MVPQITPYDCINNEVQVGLSLKAYKILYFGIKISAGAMKFGKGHWNPCQCDLPVQRELSKTGLYEINSSILFIFLK
jgi:hypothetical protein